MKLFYTLNDEGEVTLGKIVETHVVYEDLEDTAQTGTDFTSSNEFTDSGDGDFTVDTTTTTLPDGTEIEQSTITSEGDPVTINGDTAVTNGEAFITGTATIEPSTPVTTDPSAEAAVTDPKVSAERENEIQQEDTSTASFTDSERAELEALKREKKVTLLESYNESLTDEEKASLMNELDTLTYEELELKLLKIYKEKAEDEDNFVSTPVPFAVPEPQKQETADEKLNSYIRRMLGRQRY